MNKKFNSLKRKLKQETKKLIAQYKWDEAIHAITQFIENTGVDDLEVLNIKVKALTLKKDMWAAKDELYRMLQVAPTDFNTLFQLAFFYEKVKNGKRAISYYKKALAYAEKEQDQSKVNNCIKRIEQEREKYRLDRKSLLIFSYFYPPIGSSGVQRTSKYVKYLNGSEWEPIVVTVQNGTNEHNIFLKEDLSLLKDVPLDVEVIRIRNPAELSADQIKGSIERYRCLISDKELERLYAHKVEELKDKEQECLNFLMSIDPGIFWANDVVGHLNNYVTMEEIDVLYSTSGPYGNHFIAYDLKKKHRKPWVIDFRDEWSNNPYVIYNKEDLHYKLICEIEGNIICSSDKFITVSSIIADNYIRGFAIPSEKVVSITNGYDEDDFVDFNVNKSRNNKKFTIVHNGLLYGGRTPDTVFQAMSNLIKSNVITIDEIELIIPVTDNDERYKENARRLGISSCVHFVGYHAHKDCMNFLENSNLLLLIIGSEEGMKSVYTGKFFEYLRACKPILALSPKGSLVEEVILKTNRGHNVGYENVNEIAESILYYFSAFKNNSQENYEIKEIERYSRRALSADLISVLNDI